MSQNLPTWPAGIANEHGLNGHVDVFIDESGPREDRTLALGILLVESRLADAARDYFDWLASELEAAHPALAAPTYAGEWKGRLLARATASKKQRRAVGRGELLSDVACQVVYARCLDAIRASPGTRALALTYRWTGLARGPAGQPGYRIRRVIQHALSALAAQAIYIRHAFIDRGHTSHYTAGIEEYATLSGFGAIPHEFVDSADDRRIQMADLIAFAAHTSRFPGGSHIFPSAHGWLRGFAANRLIMSGRDPDHHVTEP